MYYGGLEYLFGWSGLVAVFEPFLVAHPLYRLSHQVEQCPDWLRDALLDERRERARPLHLISPNDVTRLPGLLGKAYIVAYQITGNAEDAWDAVARALYQVTRDPVEPHNFDAYFLQAVRWAAQDIRRSKIRRERRHRRVAEIQRSVPEPLSESTVTGVIREEARRLVRTAVDDLPREQRVLVELHYFDGVSRREIAEQLGIPITTVNNRLHRARAKLHAVLQSIAV